MPAAYGYYQCHCQQTSETSRCNQMRAMFIAFCNIYGPYIAVGCGRGISVAKRIRKSVNPLLPGRFSQPSNFGINSLTLSVSLIHILVFHLITTLQHYCHHHFCHHQSLLLFFHSRLKTHLFLESFPPGRLHHAYSLTLGRTVFFAHRFCFSFQFSAKRGRLSIHLQAFKRAI